MRSTIAYLLAIASIAVLSSCKKDDPSPAPSSNGGGGSGSTALTASTPLSVSMTIDGTAISYTQGSVYEVSLGSGGNITTPPDSSAKNYGFYVYPAANDQITLFGCDLGQYRFLGGLPSDATWFSFFPVGGITFGNWETQIDRVGITWWDNNNVEYSTLWGTDQTGSNFQITEILQQPSQFGISSIKVRATFNCKLYQDGGSGVKTVTNGTGVFMFENI